MFPKNFKGKASPPKQCQLFAGWQTSIKYQFSLEGGPIGWSDCSWRDKFVEWVLRFGFEPDPYEFLAKVDDPKAFYVSRLPRDAKQCR
jgi:hypothetical protein